MNHDPFWKYVILIFIIIFGLLYSLPNLYGEDPVVQITCFQSTATGKEILIQINKILRKEKIIYKSLSLEGETVLVRFSNTNEQLLGHEALINEIGHKYIISLNLIPSTPHWLSMLGAKPIKLGLDLRGGVYFLMEIDIDSVMKALWRKKIDDLRNNLYKKSLSYQVTDSKDDYSINIIFQNSTARKLAESYLTSLYHDMIISKKGGNRLEIALTNSYLKKVEEYSIQRNINVIRNRVNQLGIAESLVQRQGIDKIIVEVPGIQDITRAKNILGATTTLEFRLVNTDINSSINTILVPDDSEIIRTREGRFVVLYKRAILTGDHIIYSTASRDEYSRPQVNVSLDNIGGHIISNFTKNNIGKSVATLLVEYKNSGKKDINGHVILVKKEEIINIANIQSRLGKNFRITGIRNLNEARQLSLLLRSGALSAPVHIIKERVVGSTLGIQNIKQGLKACLSGLIFSIIFMIFFYKKFGIIAIGALISNLVLILSIMSLLPEATLTMPGIAGIVLTLALAIDSNVLINERIKEELRNGHSVQKAIDKGYKGAFASIFDANIVMLVKSFILYEFGTGSIKGFAITTSIGVITSMFTAIIGTRTIVNFLYHKKQNHVRRLSI